MTELHQIMCHTCGNVIDSRFIRGTIVYCDSCRSYRVLAGNRSVMKPVFYRIVKFPDFDTARYEEFVRKYVGSVGEGKKPTGAVSKISKMINREDGGKEAVTKTGRKLLKGLKVQSVKMYYMPTRELGDGEGRFYVPVTTERKEIFAPLFKEEKLPTEPALDRPNAEDLDVSYQYKTSRSFQGIQVDFLPVNVSLDKVDALYGADKNSIQVIKYLPIVEVATNYGTFTLFAVGDEPRLINKKEIDKQLSEAVYKQNSMKRYVANAIALLVFAAFIYGCYSVYQSIDQYITDGSLGENFLSILGTLLFIVLAVIMAMVWFGLLAIALGVQVGVPLTTLGSLCFGTVKLTHEAYEGATEKLFD